MYSYTEGRKFINCEWLPNDVNTVEYQALLSNKKKLSLFVDRKQLFTSIFKKKSLKFYFTLFFVADIFNSFFLTETFLFCANCFPDFYFFVIIIKIVNR